MNYHALKDGAFFSKKGKWYFCENCTLDNSFVFESKKQGYVFYYPKNFSNYELSFFIIDNIIERIDVSKLSQYKKWEGINTINVGNLEIKSYNDLEQMASDILLFL